MVKLLTVAKLCVPKTVNTLVPESKVIVPLEVAVPSPQLIVAVYGVGVLDRAIAPPGSVNFATMPVELTPRPAEKIRFAPLCTTAGSEIVAVLLTETVDAPRVMVVLTVSEPAAANV